MISTDFHDNRKELEQESSILMSFVLKSERISWSQSHPKTTDMTKLMTVQQNNRNNMTN